MLRNAKELKPSEWIVEKFLSSNENPNPKERKEIILELRGLLLAVEDILGEEKKQRITTLLSKVMKERESELFLPLVKYIHNYLIG